MNTKSVTDAGEPKNIRLATLETDGWHLMSGVAQHLQTPDTFLIPSEKVRSNLPVGNHAKLMFEIATPKSDDSDKTFTENMWVQVQGRKGEHYIGELRNLPVCSVAQDDLQFGDTVVFLAEHVIAVLDEEGMRRLQDKYEPNTEALTLVRQDSNAPDQTH